MRSWLRLFGVGCLLSMVAAAVQLESAHDAAIHFADGRTQAVEANRKIEIESKQAFVLKSAGRVPVLVAPTPAQDEVIKVDAPQVVDWPPKLVAEKISADLNFLMSEFESIRLALKRQQADKALDTIQSIKKKYPRLSYINFLEASALALKGERELARERLKAGLKDFPNHENAKSLLRALGGTPEP